MWWVCSAADAFVYCNTVYIYRGQNMKGFSMQRHNKFSLALYWCSIGRGRYKSVLVYTIRFSHCIYVSITWIYNLMLFLGYAGSKHILHTVAVHIHFDTLNFTDEVKLILLGWGLCTLHEPVHLIILKTYEHGYCVFSLSNSCDNHTDLCVL